jgi:hypothetical protein
MDDIRWLIAALLVVSVVAMLGWFVAIMQTINRNRERLPRPRRSDI